MEKCNEKPRLVNLHPDHQFLYDIDESDNLLSMLNRSFSGCIMAGFTKEMDESVEGIITVNGKRLKPGIFFTYTAIGKQFFGIPVQGSLNEYDTTYTVLLEGFTDTEGITMEPQEITVRTLPRKEPLPGYEEHDQIALETAREGIVLLKNEGDVLPLQSKCVLNVFGSGLVHFRLGALGAGKINPRYQVRLLRAIKDYSEFSLNEQLAELYLTGEDVIPSDEIMESACRQSDTAIIVISRSSGENLDNRPVPGEYYLSNDEELLIQTVTRKFPKTIAVINSGYPMDVRWVEKYNLNTLIICGFTGMLGGQALVEILDGRVNPSAKLPDTWSLDYYDIPSSQNFYVANNGDTVLDSDSPFYVDTVYEEDIYVGYRYFETFNKQVAYPFGFGLSYTTFSVRPVSFVWNGENIKVSVEVVNTGTVAGKEVIQVYSEEPDGILEKPARKLVAFSKTQVLDPGCTEVLNFEINRDQLASYDTKSASWIMEPGNYYFYAGNSVVHLQPVGQIKVDDQITIRQVVNRMSPPVDISILSKLDPESSYPKGKHSGIKYEALELTHQSKRQNVFETKPIAAEKPSSLILFKDVMLKPELLDSFIKQLTVEELARLSVCKSAGWGMTEIGEAGRIYPLEKYEMPDFIVTDGNCGVNVNKPNIGMPSSTTVCSSFNTELAYQVGEVIAKEAIANNIHMILAPGMNIHRNPLNGRHPEYFSEDPYLAGVMAGYQSKGLEENGVSSCLKHIVANNCESARKRNHSLLTERALREIYLKAFEIAIQIHKPDSIMTGYNACNGVYTAADEEMIQGVFREEFGFEGYVMTDWNSYDTADVVESVAAGNCWLTPGSPDNTYVTPIIEGVRDGRIEKERLEKNVKFLLSVVIKRIKQ